MPRFRRDRNRVEVRVVAPRLLEVQEALEADHVLALSQAQLSAELKAHEQTCSLSSAGRLKAHYVLASSQAAQASAELWAQEHTQCAFHAEACTRTEK